MSETYDYVVDENQPYIDMIRRLWCYGTITENDFHRELGRYFKYPKCCIDNFIRLGNMGVYASLYMEEKYGEAKTKFKSDFVYVKCAECRKK